MQIKKLREKRAKLINQMDEMVAALETAEGEVRALNEEEKANFAKLEKDVKDVDATIASIEMRRALNSDNKEEAVKEVEEKRNMADAERRALEAYFRGQDLDPEVRKMLTTSGGNAATIPTTISKTLLKKLEEQCPILDEARRFATKGTLRLLREDNYGQAAITAENANFHDADPVLSHIELKSYKITATVDATFEMLANTEIDLSTYLSEIIIKRLAKEINRLFLVGTGVSQPTGLTKAEQKVTLAAKGSVTINDFINMQTEMLPEYAQGAVWIMNRKFFQIAANLLDGNARPYMTREVVGEKIQYMFLGHKIIVDMFMPDADTEGNVPVLLANIGEGYAVNMLQDITVRHLTEIGFTEGFERFAGYLMADGKIVNEQAIVAGVVPGPTRAAKAAK